MRVWISVPVLAAAASLVTFGSTAVGDARAAQALATDPSTGIRINNGDVGVTLWGPSHRPTLNLGKADIWDRRFYGHKEKVITLADIMRAARTGEGLAEIRLGGYATYGAYDFPCPKPGGQLILGLPDPPEGWTLEAHPRTAAGELSLTATRGAQSLALRVYVHGSRNLVVLEGDAAGIESFWIRLWRHRDTLKLGEVHPTLGTHRAKTYDYSTDPGNGPMDPPESGNDGRIGWITQRFPKEPTFPDGFRYTAAAAVAGATAKMESVAATAGLGTPAHSRHEGKSDQSEPTWHLWKRYTPINEAPGAATTLTLSNLKGPFQVLVALVSSHDTGDTTAAARSLLERAAREEPARRYREHTAATLRPDYGRITRKPHGFYGDIPGCTVDTSAHCFQDSSRWHADFHFNEVELTGRFVNDQAHTLEPYYQLMERMLPMAKNNARVVYGREGCMYPLVHYPILSELPVRANVIWEQSVEITALVLKPFWQHYLYTGDREFLAKRAYPILREGARFYAGYVAREGDGCYHVFPTVSPEHWGITPNLDRNKDSQSALSLIKYHLRATAEAARLLGKDAGERERWQEIAEHLAPYPTCSTPDGPIFTDVAGAPALDIEYNIAVPLAAVFWGDDISLDSSPETVAMALRTADKIKAWKGYVDRARVRLGDTRGGLEVLLSHTGRIHLFPTVPADHEGAFGPLIAVGAFEVSAARAAGRVRGVRIGSRAGNPCRVKNPWPGEDVKVLELPERREVAHTEEGGTLRFETRAGQSYRLVAGPELTLAKQRYVPREEVVARWYFAREEKGVLPDTSGNGRHARLAGTARREKAGGVQVLALPGEDGAFASAESAPAFDFGAQEGFLLEARIRVPAGPVPPMVPILCRMAEKQYCLTLDKGCLKLYLSSPSGGVYCSATGRRSLADGEWHTVRGVRDVGEGVLRVYVDGVLEGEAPDTTAGGFTSTAPVTLGAYLWGGNSRYARIQIAEATIKRLGRLVPWE